MLLPFYCSIFILFLMSFVSDYFFKVCFCLFMVLNIFYNKNNKLSIEYKKIRTPKGSYFLWVKIIYSSNGTNPLLQAL